MKTLEPQVTKAHYSFQEYSSERKYINYYHQVKNASDLILHSQSKRILVAGKGDGVVPKILEAHNNIHSLGLTIHTFDFAQDLSPDYLGDLTEIDKVVSNDYDLVLCCQVLEHLPFEGALMAVAAMSRITRYLIISLPYKALTFRGSLKVPVLPEFEFCLRIPLVKRGEGMIDERHYWELGATLSVAKYRLHLRDSGFEIINSYIIKKYGANYFFILRSKKSDG
ncbi:MAG: class I SAM-dependent methyltransferase [Chloroflexi bacterium]|nr:class I SAM-dependent methyltransferase [Chloroflexota bacterium]